MAFIFDGLNNEYVYDATYIKQINPVLFKGKNRAVYSIIESYNIPEDQYILASVCKDVYKILPYDSVYKNKRVLIKQSFVDKYIPGFGGGAVEKKIQHRHLPPILEISEKEELKDLDGRVIPIVVCGECDIDKIYFRAKDVERMLGLTKFTSMLSDNHAGGFTEDVHYVKFDCSETKFKNDTNISKNPIVLYLTYLGFIRSLFVSRSQLADHFQKWAIKILFTHQYGNKNQRIELANDLLETTNVKAIKSFLKTDVTSLPCIYLFELGKTKDLRKIFKIPDNHSDEAIVYKYGLTNNLARRTSEHDSRFKKLGIKINLKHHAFIDCMYLQRAENDIRRYFSNMNYTINNDAYTEVVSIPVEYKPQLSIDFKQICERYNGKLTEIKIQMERMQDKLESFEKLLQVKDDMLRRQDEMIDILKMKMK
jgi:hypothetical protein